MSIVAKLIVALIDEFIEAGYDEQETAEMVSLPTLSREAKREALAHLRDRMKAEQSLSA